MRLENGRELSALEIQAEYLNRALRYAETRGLSPLEEQALKMWEHCLTKIQVDPLSLDRECDWVIKYKMIEAYRERHGLTLEAELPWSTEVLDADRAEIPLLDYDPSGPVVAAVAKLADKLGALKD